MQKGGQDEDLESERKMKLSKQAVTTIKNINHNSERGGGASGAETAHVLLKT